MFSHWTIKKENWITLFRVDAHASQRSSGEWRLPVEYIAWKCFTTNGQGSAKGTGMSAHASPPSIYYLSPLEDMLPAHHMQTDKQTCMLTFTASIYSAQLILITCLWTVEAGAARGNQLVHGENMQNVDANKRLSHISSCLTVAKGSLMTS